MGLLKGNKLKNICYKSKDIHSRSEVTFKQFLRSIFQLIRYNFLERSMTFETDLLKKHTKYSKNHENVTIRKSLRKIPQQSVDLRFENC